MTDSSVKSTEVGVSSEEVTLSQQNDPDIYPTAPADPSALNNLNSSIITEDQIKVAFAEYITEKSYCCNRPNDPQKDITLEGDFSTAFKLRFKLNSYVESRSIEKREEKMLIQNNPTAMYNNVQINQGYAGNMGLSGNPYDNNHSMMAGGNRGPMGTDFNYNHSMGISPDPMGNFHNDPMDRGMGMGVGVGGVGMYNQQAPVTMIQTQQFVAPQANMTAGIITNDLWAYNLQPAGDWWEGKRELLMERRQEQCSHCSHMTRDTCFFCHGSGRSDDGQQRCMHCNGTGLRDCMTCGGAGIVNVSRYVVAKYQNKSDCHFEGVQVEVPESKLAKVDGISLFEYEALPPIASIPPYPYSTTVNDAAMTILKNHYNEYMMKHRDSKRILKQKESLMSIPVTEATLTFRRKEYRVWIYGSEGKVYCPDMSGCCFWCCLCCCCFRG